MDVSPQPRISRPAGQLVHGSRLVRVFAAPGAQTGGNPAPVWLDADALSKTEMQQLARASGLESAFVLKAVDQANLVRMRYFVPAHEMEMCGHATIAALWVLHQRNAWDGSPTAIETASGLVRARFAQGLIEISQPSATVHTVDARFIREIADCLRIDVQEIEAPVMNAATSRVKTLVRIANLEALHALSPNMAAVEALCERLGSTGLYPFAVSKDVEDGPCVSARQFPKSSGYPEDPATGIAAAALAWGLRSLGVVGDRDTLVTVRQGEAMGSPSSIFVQLPSRSEPEQICWLRGDAKDMTESDDGH